MTNHKPSKNVYFLKDPFCSSVCCKQTTRMLADASTLRCP